MSNDFMKVFAYQRVNYKPVGTKATFHFNKAVFAKYAAVAAQVH